MTQARNKSAPARKKANPEDVRLNQPRFFIERTFRVAGVIWNDSNVRKGVDTEAAQSMAEEMINFEIAKFKQVSVAEPSSKRDVD